MAPSLGETDHCTGSCMVGLLVLRRVVVLSGPMQPLFVTFEGLDGSGKSTQLKLARTWLEEQGVAFIATHEPGGTPIGERIREIFLDESMGPMDGIMELLLVFASRRRHLSEVVDPALEAGEHVLCDRFTDSSYAYQGAGRGLPFAHIDRVDEIATGRRRPQRTLLFDVPAAVARQRGQLRLGGGSRIGAERLDGAGQFGRADRLDKEDLAFYERVRGAFLEQAERDGDRFFLIDADRSIDETFASVRAILADLCPAS